MQAIISINGKSYRFSDSLMCTLGAVSAPFASKIKSEQDVEQGVVFQELADDRGWNVPASPTSLTAGSNFLFRMISSIAHCRPAITRYYKLCYHKQALSRWDPSPNGRYDAF